MTFLFFAMLQSTVAVPDIELHATIQADSVRIEKQGDAKLEVHASPDAGSLVKVEAPKANGAKTLHNVRIVVDAEARLNPDSNLISAAAPTAETESPQPR